MSIKKYKLLKTDTLKLGTTTLYRIQSLKDFNNVRQGDFGGYIKKEENLSQVGDAKVYGDARIADSCYIKFDNVNKNITSNKNKKLSLLCQLNVVLLGQRGYITRGRSVAKRYYNDTGR